MSSSRFGWTTLGVVSAAVAASLAQTPATPQQKPPVFRAGATYVSVDVYPRRDGRFLDGLRAEDFQVFEDGKPQRIENFSLIRIEPNTPVEERREPSSLADAERQAADPRNRVFVIYLDLYHTTVSGSHSARQPIVNFLNRTIGPTDLFGVLTPEVPVSALTFGRRTETIEAELTKEWYWGRAGTADGLIRTPAEQLLQTCIRGEEADRLVGRHREDLLFTSLENLVRRLNGLRDERMHVIFISEGWSPAEPDTQLLRHVRGSAANVGVGPGGRIMAGDPRQNSCDSTIARLATMDFRERFLQLLREATRANVSFHPVDVGGLKVGLAIADAEFAPRGAGPEEFAQAAAARDARTREALNTLRDLATATDGRAVVQTNDLDGGLRRIADDLQAFYLLGYYSTNPATDGRFRRIEVKIPQPGVSLTARRGYLAPSEAMVKAADAERARAAAAAAVPAAVTEALASLARVRPDATSYGHAVRTPTGLAITAELTTRELTSGRWRTGGEVRATVSGGSPTAPPPTIVAIPAGTRSVVIPINLDASDRGPWRVGLEFTNGTAKLEQTLDVRAPADGRLGDAVWLRAGSAASTPLRPTAEPMFRRTERLRLEWAATSPPAPRLARVLNRQGEPLAIGSAVTEITRDGHTVIAVDVALAPLADGDYLVELSAGEGESALRRLGAFRMVR